MRRVVHASGDRLRKHSVFARRWNTPREQPVKERDKKKKVKTL
jgi:hypothetical protein